jgi:putative nucleotidyltransferase with HDIG domain
MPSSAPRLVTGNTNCYFYFLSKVFETVKNDKVFVFICFFSLLMLNRDEALDLLKQHIKREKLIKHCLAVEAILGELSKSLNENTEEWRICGLLHDIDFEYTEKNPEKHGIISNEILKDKVSEKILYAIKAHNYENTGCEPKSKLDFALIAADAVSGFLIATALIIPSKKLRDVKTETLNKKN